MLLRLAVALLLTLGSLPAFCADLPTLDSAVLAEINKVRTQPRSYASTIQAYAERNRPAGATRKAFDKAVSEMLTRLRSQSPMAPLTVDTALRHAAVDHATDTERHTLLGHIGSDGSHPGIRIGRYGTFHRMGEIITYGHDSAAMIVASFLVDEHDPSRGHRENVLNPAYTAAGVAMANHGTYRTACVVTLGTP